MWLHVKDFLPNTDLRNLALAGKASWMPLASWMRAVGALATKPRSSRELWRVKKRAIVVAAQAGDVELVRGLLRLSRTLPARVFTTTHTGVLDLLLAQRGDETREQAMRATNALASRGNLRLVQWWVCHVGFIAISIAEVGVVAATFGHVAIVRYLVELGLQPMEHMVVGASRYGHLAVLKYLHAAGAVHASYQSLAMAKASMNNHVAVLDWWWTLQRISTMPQDAHATQHLEALNWWRLRGLLTADIVRNGKRQARSLGNKHIVKFYRTS